MRQRVEKPDPGATYCAWQSFCSDLPTPGLMVQRGQRLAGSDPIVAAHLANFVLDGRALPDPSNVAAARADAA